MIASYLRVLFPLRCPLWTACCASMTLGVGLSPATPTLYQALESVQNKQEWQLKVNDLESRVAVAESALQNKVEECEKEAMAARRYVGVSVEYMYHRA